MKSFYPAIAILIFLTPFSNGQNQFQSQQSSTTADNGKLELFDCTVQLIQDIDLPALESGQLREVLVKPGDQIQVDQKVAQMDDTRSKRALDESTFRHQIALEQANDTTQVNTARKRYELAVLEHNKMHKLRQTRSISEQQADRARVSAEIAQLEYQGAKKTKESAAIAAAAEQVTVQASNDSINRHAIKSPINGIVYEVARDAGEWVTAGETVMRIAQMDRLIVPNVVDGNKYDPKDILGRQITATLKLARDREVQFKGKIVFVDIQRDLSNGFRVSAEVDNRRHENSNLWMLQPGNSVDMVVHLDKPVIQSAAARGARQQK